MENIYPIPVQQYLLNANEYMKDHIFELQGKILTTCMEDMDHPCLHSIYLNNVLC